MAWYPGLGQFKKSINWNVYWYFLCILILFKKYWECTHKSKWNSHIIRKASKFVYITIKFYIVYQIYIYWQCTNSSGCKWKSCGLFIKSQQRQWFECCLCFCEPAISKKGSFKYLLHTPTRSSHFLLKTNLISHWLKFLIKLLWTFIIIW